MKKYSADKLGAKLKSLFQIFDPKLVYFFGSAYKGKTGALSDIDLAVLWPEGVNVPMLKSLELQDKTKKHLNEDKFEVGCLNNQNLSFCYSVISSGKCIYGREEDRVAYETDVLSKYLDFNYLAEEYNRSFDKKILGPS
jgi:predicted nucleotidyltransferase